MFISVSVPKPDAPAVKLLEQEFGQATEAIQVPYEQFPGATAQKCFRNVLDAVSLHGGEIVYGWLVWQHGDIFIEAEHHAVWRKPTRELVCITPQNPPERTITFLPDPSAVYDMNGQLITNNVRVALVADSRLKHAFRLAEEQTTLINSVRRRNPNASASDAALYRSLEMQKSSLLSQVYFASLFNAPDALRSVVRKFRPQLLAAHREKIGRNAPCMCGSGTKYKKCCGS